MSTIDPATVANYRQIAADTMAAVRAAERAANACTKASLFAHVGFLRRSPKARTHTIGLRFYETADLLGERCGDGSIWESLEVVAG